MLEEVLRQWLRFRCDVSLGMMTLCVLWPSRSMLQADLEDPFWRTTQDRANMDSMIAEMVGHFKRREQLGLGRLSAPQ